MKTITWLVSAIRAKDWWHSKMPPLLGIGCAALLAHAPEDVAESLRAFLAALFSIASVACFGHVLNDIFDVEVDRLARKPNRMTNLTSLQRAAFCVTFLGLAFLPAVFIPYSPAALVLLSVNLVLPTLYSVPPARLKERGVAAVVADAAGAHTVPCLFLLTVLLFPAGEPGALRIGFIVSAALWTFSSGVRGILYHLLEDQPGDIRAGVATLGAAVGRRRLMRFANRVVMPVEWAAFAVLLSFLLGKTLIFFWFLAAYVALELSKVVVRWRWRYGTSAHEHGGTYLPLANNLFYQTWFPLILSVELALQRPWFVILPCLQLILFLRNLRTDVQELHRALRAVAVSLLRLAARARWRFQLNVHPPARARLASAGFDRDRVRVRILETDGTPWHVEAIRTWDEVEAEPCRFSFQARADGARDIEFALTGNREPWENLGLHGNVRVTCDWRTYFVDFTPTQRAKDARLCFWLGTSSHAVELAECAIRPIEKSVARELIQHEGCSAQLLPVHEPREADRIEILDCDGNSRHIGLARAGIEVRSDDCCRLLFSARAEHPRQLAVTLRQGCRPWADLGLSHTVELTPDWRTYAVDFAATRDERSAHLCFWLGKSRHAVELAECSIRPVQEIVAWQLVPHEDCSARLLHLHEPRQADRIEILDCDGNSRHIGLVRAGIEVRSDGRYRLLFSARAEHPRQLAVTLRQGRRPWSDLGLSHTVELTLDWRTYAVDFAATRDERSAHLCFWLGKSRHAVELAECSIRPVQEIVAWQLVPHEDCSARLLHLHEPRQADRIEIMDCDGNSGHIAVVRAGIEVRSDGLYRLGFSARAEHPRQLAVTLRQARSPWSDLGLAHTFELTPDWRTYAADFAATRDERSAHLCFWLGRGRHAVELAECAIRPIDKSIARELIQHEGCSAQLLPVHEPREADRIEILDCDGNSRHIGLARAGIEVRSDGLYRLGFSARAEHPRQLAVTLRQGRPPWSDLGLSHTVELTPDWRTYVADFAATRDERSAQLCFWLGTSRHAVELGDCSIEAIEPRQAWHLMLEGDCQAQRLRTTERPDTVRVEILQSDPTPWCIRLVRSAVGLASEDRCTLRLSARSDRRRRIVIGVWQSHEPWDSLGLFREMELAPDWQTFEEEFAATGDDPDARVGFWLGGDDASVEFADVIFDVSHETSVS